MIIAGTSSFVLDMSFVRFLVLLGISSTSSLEVTSASACIIVSIWQKTGNQFAQDQPFIAALSSLCSTELPSFSVVLVDFPEKTPESAPKMLRFRPAFCAPKSVTFRGNLSFIIPSALWMSYTGTSFRALLVTLHRARSRWCDVLGHLLGNFVGWHGCCSLKLELLECFKRFTEIQGYI